MIIIIPILILSHLRLIEIIKVNMNTFITIVAVLLLTISGCSSSERHITKTTTETSHPSYDSSIREERVVTTEESEVKESERSGGGLFSIIGDIIAWPFRVVGATLSAIF